MFANTVVIPLTIGEAFDLSSIEVASALQRSFIFTGVACLLQVLFGHKYPLMEGHSGIWWGAILSLAASASSAGVTTAEAGGGLAVGTILSGVLTAVLGALGMGEVLKKLFKPVVMSTVLFLLASQMIAIFSNSTLFISLGLIPSLGHFFSTLPVSVGNAVLFVAYLQLFFGALTNLKGITFTSKTIYRISAAFLLGIAIMNIPPETFNSLPFLIRPLLSNGLLVGIVLAIILENAVDWSKFAGAADKGVD